MPPPPRLCSSRDETFPSALACAAGLRARAHLVVPVHTQQRVSVRECVRVACSQLVGEVRERVAQVVRVCRVRVLSSVSSAARLYTRKSSLGDGRTSSSGSS